MCTDEQDLTLNALHSADDDDATTLVLEYAAYMCAPTLDPRATHLMCC